jgi:hypothetical protein
MITMHSKFVVPVLLLIAPHSGPYAQTSRLDSYQTSVESRLERIRKENDEKRLGKRAKQDGANGAQSTDSPAPPPLSTLGAHWQIRSVRYSCADGLALTTRQQITSRDFASAVAERKELSANTPQRVLAGKKLTPQTELDALETLDTTLKKLHPVELKFKFKTYQLNPERSALGLQYLSRTQGVVWTERAGKGTLKNLFSGRVLAYDCRSGVPLITDAPESADSDLSAFAPKLPGTN